MEGEREEKIGGQKFMVEAVVANGVNGTAAGEEEKGGGDGGDGGILLVERVPSIGMVSCCSSFGKGDDAECKRVWLPASLAPLLPFDDAVLLRLLRRLRLLRLLLMLVVVVWLW